MMAALIFVVSLVTLLMFFVSYCRSLTASSSRHNLSEDVRDVTGIRALPTGPDYLRVRQLLALCPERPDDGAGLQAVGAYFWLMSLTARGFARLVPALARWAECECAGCANFAIVALDRRIAFNRELYARQSEL